MAKIYNPVGWEDGEIINPAIADLTTGIVTPAEVSGTTPVNAENLKHMDEAIKQLYDEGASSKDIYIGNDNPPEDTKIWINTGEISPMHSEVVNSLSGNETTKAPSVQAVKSIYPIGSVYTSFNTTNPSEIFGGTWEKLSNIYIDNTNLIIDGLITDTGYGTNSNTVKLQPGKYIFSIENNGILSNMSQYQIFIFNASGSEKTHFTKYIYQSTSFEITDDEYSYIFVYVNTSITNVRLSLLNNNDNNVMNCWKRVA